MTALLLTLIGCDRAAEVSREPPMNSMSAHDGPAALEAAPDVPATQYINTQYGYTIAIPDGWRQRAGESDAAGSVFEDRSDKAELRVFAIPGRYGRDIVSDHAGYRTRTRSMRIANGRVTAHMRYPEECAAELDIVAAVTLNSLTLSR